MKFLLQFQNSIFQNRAFLQNQTKEHRVQLIFWISKDFNFVFFPICKQTSLKKRTGRSMSPVSPVFNTVVTVSIGLKNVLKNGKIHSIILDVYDES